MVLCINEKLFREFYEQAQSFRKLWRWNEDTCADRDLMGKADKKILNWYKKRYSNAQELMAFTRAIICYNNDVAQFLATVSDAVLL